MTFKPGDKVICIDPRRHEEYMLNKEFTISGVFSSSMETFVELEEDSVNGKDADYLASRFVAKEIWDSPLYKALK